MALPVHVFSDPNIQREFQCAICSLVIEQCYSTSCGHLFCGQCILSVLSSTPPSSSEDSSTDDDLHLTHGNNGQCPTCNRLLQIGDIFPAPYVDHKISQQIVRCIYYHKGCLWTGTFSELKHKEGHLKHCGFTLYSCKHCKEKVMRNRMVQHQNDECKANFMDCPYSIYGCTFKCRIREMEKHCEANELKHVQLKLDYLEHQLFVPEIISISGMSGANGHYVESNGNYYLKNQGQHRHHQRDLHGAHPIEYSKNGGYTLEFNPRDSIWHLRSAYYGLIAYAVPKSPHSPAPHGPHAQSAKSKLLHFMEDEIVWSVYHQHGVQESLRMDLAVRLEAVQLSDNLSRWKIGAETDTEEIHGEFEAVDEYENFVDHQQYDEGVRNQEPHGHRGGRHEQQPSWYQIVFGDDSAFPDNPLKRRRVRTKRLEVLGMIALTGAAAYYLWSKFGRSHPSPPVMVLKSKSGILIPKNFL